MYKIRLSKTRDQKTITVRRVDTQSLSGLTSITATIFTDDVGTPHNSFALGQEEMDDFVSGEVVFTFGRFFDADTVDDEFYSLLLEFNGGVLSAEVAGIGITLEATGKVYNKQGLVDVYSPQYRVDNALISAHMMLQEMNAIENQDSSYQKRIDFITRLSHIKKILNY